MPPKNSVKIFIEDGFYHVYNRGVEKRQIFLDNSDYQHFLWLVNEYLQPDHPNPNNPMHIRKGLNQELSLLCYCLMPNHFHFLIKQQTQDGLTRFMRRICTLYATYFNNRYERCGSLFQGKYKAVLIDKDSYLTYITSYIHLNPIDLDTDYTNYPYSSYQNFLGQRHTAWLNPAEILKLFATKDSTKTADNYAQYVKANITEDNDMFKEIHIDTD